MAQEYLHLPEPLLEVVLLHQEKRSVWLAHLAGEVQQQTVQQEYMELSSELNKVRNSSCRAAEGTKTGTRTGALECSVMGGGVENTAKLA